MGDVQWIRRYTFDHENRGDVGDNTKKQAMKYIEYAKLRGYELSYLLKFEISSYSLFLIDPKNGSLKDSANSNLSKELLSLIPSIVIHRR